MPYPPIPKSVLVTGCSSGIGKDCALYLKGAGWRVFATARTDADIVALKDAGLEAFYLDYTDPASIAACADTVLKETGGRIGGLVNNGAYGQPGAVEDLTTDVLRAQFEANFFGWHDLTGRLVPSMRANGAGRIVQISSVLGFTALKWRGAYNASKFALEALSDTQRLEMKPFGVHVCLIEPGPIESEFSRHALRAFEDNVDETGSAYKEAYAVQRARLGKGGSAKFKLGPEAVSVKVEKALVSPNPAPRYRVTVPTHFMWTMRRLLPGRLFDALCDKASDA